MSRYNFDRLLQKYISGKCSPQEEVMVLEWYNHLIDKSTIDITEGEKAVIQSRIWGKMASGVAVDQQPAPRRMVYKLSFYRIAAAACVILFVSFSLYYYWPGGRTSKPVTSSTSPVPVSGNTYTNNHQYDEELTLTDGSTVLLQPKATLVYPVAFTGNLREVSLTGNAFFKISPDTAKHFLVHTQGLVTEVLGTSFHIRQDQPAGKLEIAVVTGKVSVYQHDKKLKKAGENLKLNGVILTPNQKVTFNATNSQFITSLVEEPGMVAEYDKNVSERFVFEDVQLLKVLQELRRAYGIEISAENKDIENCHFTGDLTRQDLFKKLEIICQSFQASYEVRGTSIIIKGKGCK